MEFQNRIWLLTAIAWFAAATVSSSALHAQEDEVSAETAAVESADRVLVELDTTEGRIVLELNRAKAPETVANFLEYVESGHYQRTVFHRVIEGFMIQGGGFDRRLKEKPTRPPIRNEAGSGLKNRKYSVAMARKNDNPDSATCQFFINTADNDFLDRSPGNAGHAVFGRVVEGKEVVDKIERIRTYSRPNPSFPAMLMNNVPRTPVVLRDAVIRAAKSQ